MEEKSLQEEINCLSGHTRENPERANPAWDRGFAGSRQDKLNFPYISRLYGGGGGIRTHGGLHHSGFQDRRLRPLDHPSDFQQNLD